MTAMTNTNVITTLTAMTNTNAITTLTNALHSEDAPRIYSIIINTLTGVACVNVMKHLGQVRRGQQPTSDIPHIDERNEQDENMRGEEVGDRITEMQGFSVADKPMKIAQICDGIRYYLYDEMHAWGEFHDAKHLVYTKEHRLNDPINYNQPMSAQQYMDFRIEHAEELNEQEIKIHAQRMNLPEQIIRQALKDEALRNKKMLMEMKPSVLSEINSMEDVYDDSAFDLLDIETRCNIMQKISDKLDALYMRTLPRALRSLEVASELERIQRYHALVKQWLLDNDKELQQAMAYRKAA